MSENQNESPAPETANLVDVPPEPPRETSTREIPQFFVPFEAQRIVGASDLLRPLSPLLLKLIGCLNEPTTTITQLTNDVSADPKTTAELLKLANSTTFGQRRQVTNVFDAVNQLGIRRSMALLVASGIFRLQARLMKSLPEKMWKWYQRRSVLTASTAFAFANGSGGVSPDSAFVLALLQDIGILVMLQAYGDRYQHLLERAQDVGQLRLDALERQELSITHADVSAALVQKWELPTSLVSLVFQHHDAPEPRAEPEPETEQNCLRVMRLGESVGNLMDSCAPQRLQVFESLIQEQSLTADQIRNCLALAVTKTAETNALFTVLAPDTEVLRAILEKLTRQGDSQQSRGKAPPPHARPVDGPQPYWLVIDDEPIIGKVVARILKTIGLAVKSCCDATAAMQLAGGAQGILCDVHLGKERGTDIVRLLRESGITVPVLMMTGDAKRSTVLESIEAGISDYILKPVTAETLIDKIRQHQPDLVSSAAG